VIGVVAALIGTVIARALNLADTPGFDWTELLIQGLPAADVRAGWRYAHWLVAHAKVGGVKRVRYDDREWTAEAGTWSKLPSGRPDRSAVLAEVYGDT